MAAVEYQIIYNLLPEIAKQLHTEVAAAIKAVAQEIQSVAGVNAPQLTGFLHSSIYVVTQASSDYGVGVVPGASGSYLLPEVPHPTDDQSAIIAVGANYGVFVETGTSRMASQPYLLPAAADAIPRLEARLSAFESKIVGIP